MKKTLRISVLTLMLLFVFTFVACAPKDMDAAQKKLEKENYEIVYATTYSTKDDGSCGSLSAYQMINFTKGNIILATLYESKADAKAAYEKGGFDKDEDQKVQRIGKWVVVGTEEAIKAFK